MTLPDAVLSALGGAPLRSLPLGPRTTRQIGPTGSVVERRADSARKLDQERRALGDWGPATGRCPALLGQLGLRLWMTDLGGRPGAAADDLDVYDQLGVILAKLAAQAPQPDPLPLPEAIAARRAALLRGPAAAALRPLLERVEPGVFAGAARQPAHRDLAPRNWLVTDDGEVGMDGVDGVYMVDLEHAAADAPGTDLARLGLELRLQLDPEATKARMDRLEAARQRAGGPPVPEGAIEALVHLTAAGTLAWGLRHRDAAFIARGERWGAIALDTGGKPW